MFRPVIPRLLAKCAAEPCAVCSGLGREMKAVGHEHDITCNPEIEPYWEPPEGMTRKDIVAADKAKMVDHRWRTRACNTNLH